MNDFDVPYSNIGTFVLPTHMRDKASYVFGVLKKDYPFMRGFPRITLVSLIPAGTEIVFSIATLEWDPNRLVLGRLVLNYRYSAYVPRNVLAYLK